MDLPVKAHAATVVWYQDLEKFLEGIYGIKPDIQAGEYGQDTYIEFEVKDFETDSNVEEDIKTWIKSASPYIDWELVGLDLARRKVLPEGNYLITIWW